ncbi:MAG TPA: hypothetical protein VHJ76_07800, partial [Actinomycetota bacterium]|nr:hypothetical protein [Actinomycetota bacterium]
YPTVLIGAQTLLRYDDASGVIQPEPSTTLNGPFEPVFAPSYPADRRFLMGGTRIDKGVLKSAVFTCSRAMCTWNVLRGGRGAPKIRLRHDYATSNVGYAFTQNGLYKSSDVWGFSPVETPWPEDAILFDVALSGSDTVFAAVAARDEAAPDGLYRSDDGGATWSHVVAPLLRDGATGIAVEGDRMIVTLTESGVACSSDGGQRWSRRC